MADLKLRDIDLVSDKDSAKCYLYIFDFINPRKVLSRHH